MPEYDNRNTFTLFRNTKKRDGKNDPDFNGTFTDKDGKEHWISAWSKTPKSGGDKFLSGNVKVKDAPRSQPQVRQTEMVSDDIPF